MEELFLGGFLALQELDVIDHQNVEIAVAPLEGFLTVIAQGINVVVREFFRRHILHAQTWMQYLGVIAGGMQKVRFTQTRATPDK